MYHTSVTEQGLGHYVSTVTYFEIRTFAKGIFISEICWTFVIWTVKCSILAFYWRLFSPNRRSIQVIIWILAVVVMVWGVAVVGARPLSQRDVGEEQYSRIPDNRLVTCHSTSMYSCRRSLEPWSQWYMPDYPVCDLCGLVDTTYCHRRSASGISSTINLEPSYA